MSGLDLFERPVNTKNYHIYDICHLPKVFLGIRVKNKLDEHRLSIKSKYSPKLITHFKCHSQLEPAFFYGIEVTPKKRYMTLLDLLNNKIDLSSGCTYDKFLQTYRILLNSYDLSCHTCYSYLSDGIYPIDVNHLDNISRKDFSAELESGFSCMVKKTSNPFYMNIHNFNLFVLGEATGYRSDFTVNNVLESLN